MCRCSIYHQAAIKESYLKTFRITQMLVVSTQRVNPTMLGRPKIYLNKTITSCLSMAEHSSFGKISTILHLGNKDIIVGGYLDALAK